MHIKAENLLKRYGKNIAIENVSFEIKGPCVACVLGPNGAGKSTLLKILAGFEKKDKGRIFINSIEVENYTQIQKKLAYLPEDLEIYPEYRVGEFLEILKPYSCEKELIRTLSLEKVFDKKIKELSKGWYQRVKLYSILAQNKPIIFLDEPFTGFDPLQISLIEKILKNYNKTLFLLALHQLSLAEKICDSLLVLHEGRLLFAGKMPEEKSLEEFFFELFEDEKADI